MFIYLTTNKINGKKYIGMCDHIETGLYLGSGKILKQAIKKYGRESFERIILEECNTREELESAEKHWIEHFDAVNSDEFYNIADGGAGGNSLATKKYWDSLSPEQRKERNKHIKDRYSPGFKGKTHTKESRLLIGSKSVNRNWIGISQPGAKNGRAKKVLIEDETGIHLFGCLKEYADIHSEYSYSLLKKMAQECTKSLRKIIETSGKHKNIKRLIYYESYEEIAKFAKDESEIA